MKNFVFVALTALLLLSGLTASAQEVGIHLGCFHYGPNNCDITANPPTIDTGGFHYGPQAVATSRAASASGDTPQASYKVASLQNEQECFSDRQLSNLHPKVGDVVYLYSDSNGELFSPIRRKHLQPF